VYKLARPGEHGAHWL